jgi:hypothetical protein
MRTTPTRIIFSHKSGKELSPDDLVKSFWLSTAMALVLVIPPLAIFVSIHHTMEDILTATLIGFGVHFVILAFSIRICSQLERLFKD